MPFGQPPTQLPHSIHSGFSMWPVRTMHLASRLIGHPGLGEECRRIYCCGGGAVARSKAVGAGALFGLLLSSGDVINPHARRAVGIAPMSLYLRHGHLLNRTPHLFALALLLPLRWLMMIGAGHACALRGGRWGCTFREANGPASGEGLLSLF